MASASAQRALALAIVVVAGGPIAASQAPSAVSVAPA
jgi:hypothetical protein